VRWATRGYCADRLALVEVAGVVDNWTLWVRAAMVAEVDKHYLWVLVAVAGMLNCR
jgi:hypothetical protein